MQEIILQIEGKHFKETFICNMFLQDHIFTGKRPCDEQILEAYLKEEFGEKTTLDMIPVDGKK